MISREDYLKLTKEERSTVTADLNSLIKEACSVSDEATNALKILKPSLFGIGKKIGEGSTPKYKIFGALFVNKGDSVDEMKIFQELKAGRHECTIFIRDLIKKSSAKEIKWVSFDPESGLYKLEKIGENSPKDWTGYVPSEKTAEDEVNLV
jgi:hypothetical protein